MDISDAKRAAVALQIINDMDDRIKSMYRTSNDNDDSDSDRCINRVSAEEMDEKRHENIAYEYLCHLEEAKKWIESCIREELPSTTELEENLRNGVYLAKLSNFFCPEQVPFKKIYDKDQSKFKSNGLQFRHTDNINHWFNAMQYVGLPKIFFPETTDIYDRKNMPRVIYCLHALSLYLFKLGIAPQIQDLYGVAKFTEEEISNMAKELQKYGLQMPAFSKIGGILANEMPIDEAALHAAILAINDAIEKQSVHITLNNLKLYDAHLINVIDDNAKYYLEVMYEAKFNKSAIAKNKATEIDYVPDVYDELLTQAEIQGFINKINMEKLFIDISNCINQQDADQLLNLLKSKMSPFKNVIDSNADWYLAQLTQEKESKLFLSDINANNVLDREIIQNSINIANKNAEREKNCMKLVDTLNNLLFNSKCDEFLLCLKNASEVYLPQIDYEYAYKFYYQEFKSIQVEKGSNLDIDDFIHGIHVLNAIVLINKAIDSNNCNEVIYSLKNKSAHLQDIDDNLCDNYMKLFLRFKEVKLRKSNNLSTLLTYGELQDSIVQANYLHHQEILKIARLKDLLINSDYKSTVDLLKELNLIDVRLIDNNAYLYHIELGEFFIRNGSLSIEDTKTIIENCNNLLYNALNMSKIMILINKLDLQSKNETINLIKSKTLNLNLKEQFLHAYYVGLVELRRKFNRSSEEIAIREWFCNRTSDDKHEFYLNLKNNDEFSWTKPNNYIETKELITREILKNEIHNVTCSNERLALYEQNKNLIISLQAHVKGYLTRKQLKQRLDYLYNQIESIIKIQSWWRMVKQRRDYLVRLNFYKVHLDSIIKIQSLFRMVIQSKKFNARRLYWKQNEKKIVKAQSVVRAKLARNDYLKFVNEKIPPLNVIRKFVHLLEHNNIDFKEEIEIQQLKRQVITLIKTNKNLEQDLDMMDVKIGLLVKNRITLQDVLTQHKKLKKYKEDIETNQIRHIKQLNKENHERIELYQNLFYLLQTEPKYLAKLLFVLPPTNSSKFIESVVLELFNYGANSREEYLLLKLFTHALHEEIESKVDKITEIITGNPLVIKVIVSLYRKYRGENVLRKILNSTIVEFLNDKSVQLCLNPTEIYKSWINRIETESGKPTGYPYDVNTQKALENEEVRKQLEKNIESVKLYTSKFQQLILDSLNKIPYGLRYIAKVLRLALKQKFPQSNEREILKIIGNLVLCRFINSAICSPDVYDVIDVQVGVPLDIEDRKNLACIAKHLQLIAMSKGYGDSENAHLACLNSFIKDSHDQMRNFFYEICQVQDSESNFGINEFSDLIQLTKPTVYITVQEICDTHRILIDNLDKIAPEKNDALNEILSLLGPEPNFDSIINDTSSSPNKTLPHSNTNTSDSLANKSILSNNTQICLTLTSRFTPIGDESADLFNLFIKTKRYIVDIIQCHSGENLMQILNSPTTQLQDEKHLKLLEKRELSDSLAESSIIDSAKIVKTFNTSLNSMKIEVKQNLVDLETAGMVSSENNYEALICRIAQDIRNQRKHRQRRQKELAHLKEVAKVLENKKTLLQEQVGYYNEYVKACLDGLNNKANKSKSKNPFKRNRDVTKSNSTKTIKYTGSKLYEKGVLLEIDGLQQNQLKNVLFEISLGEEPGIFEVQAKFMNLQLEKHEILFQDLLQMQYEGAAIMKIFDRAKVNVNLLIFLLNKKFYGK